VPPAKRPTRKAATKRPARKVVKKAVKKAVKSTKKAVKATASAGKRSGPKQLSARHKAALATGRTESRHVRAYLDALEAHRPRRGRQRTADTVKRQLAQVERELQSATGFRKLELAARRLELATELETKQVRSNVSELRKNFVKHAASYARRKGIPKQAFRDAGVPASDIRDARIP